ncbi:peptidase M24 [Thermincola ferriacetica]|uniref:Peptidase M24 n=1 Tax=Thermincola ferriacetica TaxID=281456 RepID=A0A0L6W6G6_9FIRM|nr:Xaa-Pro peptidase family protein [Thermincola ferriacetica]KNZ70704.1 peptidase M24 [Thermincola ferriacetica]
MNQRLLKVQKKIAELELDALLVTGVENRRYLSGFTGTSAILLISPAKAFLITDFRYLEQAEKQAPDFRVVSSTGLPDEALADLVDHEGYRTLGFEADHLTYQQFKNYGEKMPGVTLKPLRTVIEKFREVKDDQEIQLLRKAVAIADKAFTHILDFLRPGITEKEIANELEYYMKTCGAEKSAFDLIIASGSRSALPHGVASGKKLAVGDFVVLDFGCVYQGYHSDMTRTVVLGKASPEQKKIYNIVLEAQKRATAAIAPGKVCSEIDAVARDLIAKEGYGSNFGHGLGHSIGLAIHEKPALAPRDQSALRPGMTVTVEPGIYIRDWGGVRIEDIVVVTGQSVEVLTQSTKKLLEL